MRIHSTYDKRWAEGLTLLELVVVLAILAATTALAVRVTNNLVNETRFDVTSKVLDGFRTACIGVQSTAASGSAPQLSSFVSDMGRLPNAQANGSRLTLQELVSPAAAPAYAFRTSENNDGTTTVVANPGSLLPISGKARGSGLAQVQVPSGWRGPYIYTKDGGGLVDGWGKSIEYDPASTAVTFWRYATPFTFVQTTLAGQPVARIVIANGSFNSFSAVSDDPYVQGVQSGLVNFNDILAQVIVQVTISGGTNIVANSNLRVDTRVFGPNPAANSVSSPPIRCVLHRSAITAQFLSVPVTGPSDTPLLIGPKVITCELVNPATDNLAFPQSSSITTVFLHPGINFAQATIVIP